MSEQGVVQLYGQPKQAYYTPDGRKIMAMPDMHGYVKRNAKGKPIEEGVRDVNFDKGWLPQPPVHPVPYCPHCTNWHQTEAEVVQCGEKKGAFMAKIEKEVKDEQPVESISELKAEMTELKSMFKQILEKL